MVYAVYQSLKSACQVVPLILLPRVFVVSSWRAVYARAQVAALSKLQQDTEDELDELKAGKHEVHEANVVINRKPRSNVIINQELATKIYI